MSDQDYLSLYQAYCSPRKMTSGATWFNCHCPFHEDPNTSKTASFGFNPSTGRYKCQGCGESGDAVAFYGHRVEAAYTDSKEQRVTVAKKLMGEFPHLSFPWAEERPTGGSSGPGKLPSERNVETWHADLLKDPVMLKLAKKSRRWTLAQIEALKIGVRDVAEWKDGAEIGVHRRFMIPVREGAKLKNVRKYLPAAPKGVAKCTGIKGRNEKRIFPEIDPSKKTIFVVEGEPDAIAARSAGLHAVTFTGGALNVPRPTHTVETSRGSRTVDAGGVGVSRGLLGGFAGKQVVILYDVDANDQQAGQRGGRALASALLNVTEDVRVIDIAPILPQGGKDVTDILLSMKRREFGKEIQKLILSTPVYVDLATKDEATLLDVEFEKTTEPGMIGRTLTTRAVVMGIRQQPYDAITKLCCSCDHVDPSSTNKEKPCVRCPLVNVGARNFYKFPREIGALTREIVGQANVDERTRKKLLKDFYGLGCERFEIDDNETERTSLFEATVAPEILGNGGSADSLGDRVSGISQRQVFVTVNGTGPPSLNQVYECFGTALPLPWNGVVTNLFEKIEPVSRRIDTFQLESGDDVEAALGL